MFITIAIVTMAILILGVAFLLIRPKKEKPVPPPSEHDTYMWDVEKFPNDAVAVTLYRIVNEYNKEFVDRGWVENTKNLTTNQLDDEIAKIKTRIIDLHNVFVKHNSPATVRAFGKSPD